MYGWTRGTGVAACRAGSMESRGCCIERLGWIAGLGGRSANARLTTEIDLSVFFLVYVLAGWWFCGARYFGVNQIHDNSLLRKC